MVNATVDNEPISITLKKDESTTVPSGEVWKVTISVTGLHVTADGADYVYRSTVLLNGTGILSAKKLIRQQQQSTWY